MKQYFTLKNILIAVAGIVLIYTLLGFLAVPFAGKKLIVSKLNSLPGHTGKVGSLSFNPFTLETSLGELEINGVSGAPFFRLQRLYVNLSVASLFKLAPVVTRLDLDRPELFLVLGKDNQLNIAPLVSGESKTPPASEVSPDKGNNRPKKRMFPFRLSNAGIHDGRFYFKDEVRNETQKIEAINLTLPLLSSLEKERDARAEPILNLGINGAPVEIRAASLPFNPELETRIELNAKKIDLAAILPYLTLPDALTVSSPGRLDLALSCSYRRDPARKNRPHILGADATLAWNNVDLRIQKSDTRETAPLFSCPEFIVEASSKDILSGDVLVEKLAMNNAKIELERDGGGRLTLMTLFPGQVEGDGSPGKEDGAGQASSIPFHISLAAGGINKAAINFMDHAVEPAFKTAISGLNINFKEMEIKPEGIVSSGYDLNFSTEADERLHLQGRLATSPALAVDGRLDLGNILPEKYRPYYATYGGKGLAIGKIEGGAGFTFSLADNTSNFTINDGKVDLREVRIQGTKEGEPVVDISAVDCAGISVDSDSRRARIETLRAESGAVDLVRDQAGQLNLAQRLNEMFPGPAGSADPGAHNTETSAQPPATLAKPWDISLGRFDLKQYELAFSDFTPGNGGEQVRINIGDIRLSAQELSTVNGAKAKVQAGLNIQKKGRLDLDGELSLSPPAAVLDLNIKDIPVNAFQPYFTDYLNIVVTKGRVGTKGRLRVEIPQSDGPDIRFKGEAGLSDFLSQTKADNNDFFRCKSLFLSGMDIDLSPVQVDIKEIALTDFYQKSVISQDGTLSLSTIARSPADEKSAQNGPQKKAEKSPKETGAAPVINIGAVTLQGGHINFTDHHNSPGFSANMTEVGGSITGLSSLPDKAPAQLLLKGTHGRQSPLDISGVVDPFKEKPFADLAISFKNIELPQFSAYTEKYLGYPIDKGKLILDLKYKVQGDQLQSSNHIFFDQLTLGEAVESPDAVSLPIELAISLLKNSEGEIELDVPIEGDLNDPEFSYGDVVATTFKNLILGIVTAPFKFLGSLVGLGDSEDLGQVAFLPGSHVLTDGEKAKIDQLSGILGEKEALNLEIQGRYNPEKDGARIREMRYQELLAAAQAEAGVAVETPLAQLTADQRLEVVDVAYARATFPKPRDKSGNEKELSVDEKEKLLITSISVGENELDDLAARRGEAVRDHMVQGGITPLRIFLKEPGAVAEEQLNEEAVKTLFELK